MPSYTNTTVLPFVLTLLLVASCSISKAAPDDASHPVEAEIEVTTAKTDPGAQLERNLGSRTSVVREVVSVPTTSSFADGDHYYPQIDLAGEPLTGGVTSDVDR
ncbi:MAG: hypothetical protein ACNA8W_04780 [Bradymonadaceae bacterium]